MMNRLIGKDTLKVYYVAETGMPEAMWISEMRAVEC